MIVRPTEAPFRFRKSLRCSIDHLTKLPHLHQSFNIPCLLFLTFVLKMTTHSLIHSIRSRLVLSLNSHSPSLMLSSRSSALSNVSLTLAVQLLLSLSLGSLPRLLLFVAHSRYAKQSCSRRARERAVVCNRRMRE